MAAKIDVESDVVLNLVKSYKDVNNDLETMASGCKKPDIPKCLDIGSNIDGLMGVVQNAEAKLGTKMLDVVGVLNDTIDILKKSDGFDLVELYHIEDNFDIKYNGGDFVEQILKDEAKITMEEFIDLLNCSDSMFSNLYDEIKKDFQNKLILEHQSFLMNKEPKIINGLIESIYVSNTKYKIGTEDFKKGLEDFKNTFANFVLSNNVDYPHDDKYMKDESNIPSNMWFGEEIADYDKALLLLSFGKQDIIGYNIGNFCRGYENNNFEYKYDTFEYSDSFQTLINANNWFNNDFENYDIKQIVSDYQALLEGLTSSANSNAEGVINIINSATGKSLDKDLWIYALDENHYLDSMYRNNPNLTTEDIVQNTFNGSYLSNIYSEYGIDGLNSLLGTYFDSILDDKDFGLKSCLSNGLLAKLSNVNCFENVYKSISVPAEEYISKKLELDKSKENFNMALARSLDTSNVTENDRTNALRYLGDNVKYLKQWQIDTYALLWNKDTNIDFEEKYLKALDDKVYHNTVASGKGYEAAIEQLIKMNLGSLSDKEIEKIVCDIFGVGYSIAGGLYDGILNSIKGVARLVTADGIMSVDDYRQSYLQELLSTDFRIYTDYYNKNSANHDYVVNMLSNNYDLDNLSKYKDKNGMNIFDSEYLKKAEENNLTLYEMLYQKGYINQDEYLKYYNLDQRKNDGNMWLYSGLGENLVFKDIGKWTYNISSGIGNMAIPMALAAFVNPAAMSAWMFASVTGNEREQLLLSGKNNDLGTYLHAASKGLMAVGTEKFLGALTGYGAKADDILSVFKMDNSLMTKFMSTGFGKTFAKVLSNQVNETVEELVENVGYHLSDLIADGTIPDGNALWKETWLTALTTFATTPLINLMGKGMQEIKYNYGNRRHTHNMNVFDANYSNNELAQFTKDGVLDYEGFVSFLFENGRISNVSLERGNTQLTGSDVTSVPKVVMEVLEYFKNPDEKLSKLRDELSMLFVDKDSSISDEQLEKIAFITKLLCADSSYRSEHLDILKDITSWIGSYKEQNIESKNAGSVDYDGINIQLYGEDLEFLKQSVIKLKRAIDELPKVLRNMITDMKIYDSSNPYNLYFLLDHYPNDKSHLQFIADATCNYVTQTISFYKEWARQSESSMLGTLKHETGHSIDATFSTQDGWFTDLFDSWKNAKEKDSSSVSSYGDTNIREDFAESILGYFNDTTLFKSMFPNRARILDAIVDTYNAEGLDEHRKNEIMEIFKDSESFRDELLHKLFGTYNN